MFLSFCFLLTQSLILQLLQLLYKPRNIESLSFHWVECVFAERSQLTELRIEYFQLYELYSFPL